MNYEDVKKWIEDSGFQNNALRSDRNHRIDLYLSDVLHAFAVDLVKKNDLLSDVSKQSERLIAFLKWRKGEQLTSETITEINNFLADKNNL